MKQIYDYLVSLAAIALVVAGIGGASYNAFRDHGWLEEMLGRVWSFELDYPMVAIPLTLTAALVFYAWRTHHVTHGTVSRVPSMLIYTLMGAGAYFIGQVALYGSL